MVQLLANVLLRQHSVTVNGVLSPKALDSRFSSTFLPGSEVQEVRLEIENRGKQVRLSVRRDGRLERGSVADLAQRHSLAFGQPHHTAPYHIEKALLAFVDGSVEYVGGRVRWALRYGRRAIP